MTTIAPNTAASAWMSRSDLARASGLREDLVAGRPRHRHRRHRVPGTPGRPGVYVKELTDHKLPPAAVEEKVRVHRPPARPARAFHTGGQRTGGPATVVNRSREQLQQRSSSAGSSVA